MSDVLRKAKPAKPNLSKGELSALRDIRRDSSIHILTADKGNATVIYSIEILHGVTAITLTYHPHHAKLQVLPIV